MSKLFYFFLVLLIIYYILDFIFTADITKSSCRLTNHFQKGKDKSGSIYQISKLLSSYFTNWYFILLILSYFFSNNFIQFYQYVLIWILPYAVVVTERSLYARGRPLYLCDALGNGLGKGDSTYGVYAWSCSCSFGMPSSHSCTAVSISYALWLVWRRWKIDL
jgi:membrane-associated phospholipid phosphatase